jgi:hypothetical protein
MLIRLSGGSNPHTTPSAITLYVAKTLPPEDAKTEASRICHEAEADMHRLIDRYHEHQWWQRFLKFCHTGK